MTEKWSKHIDIRFHYIREVIERKLAEVFFIDGDKNPADLLTKNLGSVKFLQFRPHYGLCVRVTAFYTYCWVDTRGSGVGEGVGGMGLGGRE